VRISIVTVTLNSAASLHAAMQSVLDQDDSSFEYIIVDGGSTDETLLIAEQFRTRFGSRLRITSEPDEGTYDAMNKGIRLARGDVIGILNSDDVLLSGALAAVASAFESGNADVVYGDVIAEGEFGNRVIKATMRGMDRAMTIPHPGCFVHASAYARWGAFNTRYRIAADYELLLRFISRNARFVNLHQAVARFREGGVSSRSFALAREAYGIHEVYFGRAHALRCGFVRVSAAILLNLRKSAGSLLLGKERYARLRSAFRGG